MMKQKELCLMFGFVLLILLWIRWERLRSIPGPHNSLGGKR